jgi:signal transduction histidine kinase
MRAFLGHREALVSMPRSNSRDVSVRAVCAVIVFLLLGIPAFAQGGGGVSIEMKPDGRTYSIKAPGLGVVNAMAQVGVEIGGVGYSLRSTEGKAMGTEVLSNQSTPYGMAEVVLSRTRFEREGIDLLVRLERIEGLPVALVNAGIRVFGKKGCDLMRVYPLWTVSRSVADGGLQLEGGAGEWLLTGVSVDDADPRQFPQVAAKPLRDIRKGGIIEQCSLYNRDGRGVLIGPVGEPVAFANMDFRAMEGDGWNLSLSSDMSRVRVDSGETRWGQQIGLFFEPPQAAWDRWVDWVAKTHGSRTALGGVAGWLSPSYDNPGKKLLQVVEAVENSTGIPRPQAVVIENNYRKSDETPLETNSNFPEGLPFYARKIADIHAAPGLFFQFDEALRSRAEIHETLGQALGMGFKFFKIMYQVPGRAFSDRKTTNFQETRQAFQDFRKVIGEETALLSVLDLQRRAVLGAADSSRVTQNVFRASIRERIASCLWAMPLANRWFAVDNDAFYLATELEGVSPVVGGWPMARTWMSMVGLSCGNAFTTDVVWGRDTFKPYWRNLQVLTPPARERTRVLDLGISIEWPRLAGKVSRDWGEWVVALLWNPENKERVVELDLARAGLNPAKRHAVWSFWDNRYLGVVGQQYKTPFLAPSASQHLVFTELPEDPNKPTIIGSNLHIYCGAAEFKNVVVLPGGMRLELSDAGARDGSVFVYCQAKPAVEAASGLRVEEVVAAGENVWEVKIKERDPLALQRIDFSVPETIFQQGWFWFLSALLAASGGFGVWRYIVSRRSAQALESEKTRQQERARIARDLHDELGATLARIAMLTDAAASPGEAPSPVLQKVLGFSKEGLRRLDEIVWAVNPARDTLDNMVDYLCKFAEGYLSDAGIRFRFESPEHLPDVPVSSKVRHAVYMVVREAIHNAAAHSSPSIVRLGIALESGECRVEIHDDGCGFDPARASTSRHGLANMRARIAEIGGRVDLSSAPGSGTTVSIRLPLTSLKK